PEDYLADPIHRRHYFEKFSQLKRADAMLAISQHSADEAAQFVDGFQGPVVNISGGVDPKFRVLSRPPRGSRFLVGEYEISGDFVLYTSSFDQRKNHRRLIKAFADVSQKARRNCRLVIAGNGWPEIYEELRSVARKSGLQANDVVFVGRVTDDELVELYNRCTLFVFPSLWEGLGLPVLEAMACGAPVIGSNTTSMPEVLGLTESTFDPTDVAAISEKIELALADASFRDKLKVRGREHVKSFTWEASARRALDAIGRVS